MRNANRRDERGVLLQALSTTLGDLNQGDAAAAAGDAGRAIEHYRVALDSARQGEEPSLFDAAVERLAGLYASLGDYPRALDLYQDAMRWHRERSSGSGCMAGVQLHVADLLMATGDRTAARHSLESALDLARAAGDTAGELHALCTLIDLELSEEHTDEALELATRALAAYQERSGDRGVARVESQLACIHRRAGRPDQALAFARRALERLRRTDDLPARAALLLEMGEALGDCAKVEEGRYVLEEGVRVAEGLGDLRLQVMFQEALADLLARSGDASVAFEHLRSSITLREKLLDEEKQREIAALEVRFELERVEREREYLRRRSEELQAELEKRESELSALALHLIERDEMLASLRSALAAAIMLPPGEQRAEITRIQQQLAGVTVAGEGWNLFERELAGAHQEFIARLSSRFPELTATEVRVCSLLRINLTTKDIAQLLNTTTRNVETHRYWIRKKMGLERRQDLVTYLGGV